MEDRIRLGGILGRPLKYAAPMTALGERVDVEFRSGEETCRAWFYRPAEARTETGTGTGFPCVVMAHGLGATKHGRLDAYAERFAAAGLAALVFDYRHFGESSGLPRELIDIKRQHEDYRAAVTFARELDGVDAERIALWGTSFSGGHAVWTAAHDPRIAAVVAQIPHASGPAGVLATGPKRIAYFLYAAIRDQIGSMLGRPPFYLPVVGPPGAMAALTTDGADDLYRRMYPVGYDFPNRAAARMGLRIGTYSPKRAAHRVACPLLVVIGDQDTITPVKPARALADRAPQAELLVYPGGHFDAYFDECFETLVAAETRFLQDALVQPS